MVKPSHRFAILCGRPLVVVLLISIGTLVASSCQVTDGDSFTNTYSYRITADSKLITAANTLAADSSTIRVEDGNELVFMYRHRRAGQPDFEETLAFSLPDTSRRFSFSTDQLHTINATYRRQDPSGTSVSTQAVTTGTIRGQKLSAVHWIVNVYLPLTPAVTVQFEEPFYVD